MAITVALLLSLVAAVAACGGSSGKTGGTASSPGAGGGTGTTNGIAAKAPGAILSAATGAIQTAKSVHVSGTTANGGTPITVDLNIATGKGGSGRLSENGWSAQIVVLKKTAYINGSDSFWRHFGGSFAAQLFHGKWLRAPATGKIASLAELTNLPALFNKLSSNHGTLAKGATSTINGQQVIAIKDTTTGGTMYVATKGKPYPVEISKPGAQGGRFFFDRYDQPVSLTAPANSVALP